MEIFNPPVRYRWRPLPEEIQKAQMTTCGIYAYEQNRMLAEQMAADPKHRAVFEVEGTEAVKRKAKA